MSVFTIIRRGRQAAKEHNAKQAEKQKKETVKEPYRHVPTHAAIDALAGAPSSWREEDRPRILEQNRRRSAMAASGMGRGMPGNMTPVHVGMPRVNSSLSHVTYPSVYASPIVQMPRNYSHQSVHQGWSDRGGEVVYSPVEQGSLSGKGKDVERAPMVDSGRASRSSSKATSPVGSSNDSTSSHDDLEMKPGKGSSTSQTGFASDAKPHRVAGESDVPHRLHPSRRVSDPSAFTSWPHPQPRGSYYPPSASAARSGSSRISAPVTASGIPPVPAIPLKHYNSGSSQPSRASSAASNRGPTNGKGSPSSSLASIAHIPTTAANIDSSPPTPKAVPASSFADAIPDFAPIAPALTEQPHFVGTAITTPTVTQTTKRTSQTVRPRGPERTSSNFSQSRPSPAVADETSRVGIDASTLPTHFDESSFLQSPAPVQTPAKGNKLSKSQTPKQSKLVKKNRWSFRSKPTAVAF